MRRSTRDDFLDLEVRRAARRPPQDANVAFHGVGALTGRPTLKLVPYLNDRELAEAAELPDDVRTLTGRPVRDVAREEIERRRSQ